MELNEEKIKEIVGFVEKGILQDEACEKAGIDQQTFDEWERQRKNTPESCAFFLLEIE